METIENLAVIKLVRAAQIRRNEAAKGERIRKAAMEKYVRYFSNLFFKGKDDMATR